MSKHDFKLPSGMIYGVIFFIILTILCFFMAVWPGYQHRSDGGSIGIALESFSFEVEKSPSSDAGAMDAGVMCASASTNHTYIGTPFLMFQKSSAACGSDSTKVYYPLGMILNMIVAIGVAAATTYYFKQKRSK